MEPRDLQVLAALEGGLLVPDPYGEIGRKLGMSGDEVLERVQTLRDACIIRRFRARINQLPWYHCKCPCRVALQWTGREQLERSCQPFPGHPLL